jgi:phenylacetate-CoA ligase
MKILPVLRTLARSNRSQAPRQDDLDSIIADLRRKYRPAGGTGDGQARGAGRPSGPLARVFGRNPEARLRAYQARQLHATVAYAYQYVPYYREALDKAGVRPADIRTPADIGRLPITRREQLEADSEAFISRKPGLEASVLTVTSGTTRGRLHLYMSGEELQLYASTEALGGLASGLMGPDAIVQSHFSMDDSVEAQILARACHKAGALVLTYGHTGTLDQHVASLLEERHVPGKASKVTMLFASPSHLWAMANYAQERGLDMRQSGLRHIATGGAMVSEDLKNHLETAWGVRPRESYGITELPSIAATECPQGGRLHFLDTGGFMEVLDPQTLLPVVPGQPGVLVITSYSLARPLMPLIRYWTEDLVIAGTSTRCQCGSVNTQIVDILGRADHMIVVGQHNFYPQEIGDSLLAFDELAQPPRFQASSEERSDGQYVQLDVEARPGLDEGAAARLQARIGQEVVLSRYWQARLGAVKVNVNVCPPGSIEHPFSYKHRHLVLDRRDGATGANPSQGVEP